jgi:CYTH domain-containing protein
VRKLIAVIAIALPLMFAPSANADTVEEKIAKANANATLAIKTAGVAKARAEYALLQAKRAETISKATVKDVEALRLKTTTQLQSLQKELAAFQKQLDALTKLLKTLA